MNSQPLPEESDLAAYERIQTSCAALLVDDAAALEFSGGDRLAWLQGQVTQDLRGLVVGSSVGFCMCLPSGRLLTAGRLAVLPDRVVAVVPQATVRAVLDRVEEAVFLEDVAAHALSDHVVWTVLGAGAATALRETGCDRAFERSFVGRECVAMPTDRAQTGGFDLVLPAGATPTDPFPDLVLTTQAVDILETVRLEAGTPRWGADMDDHILPSEMGHLFESSHVSYGKGCYTGQEILMRIHSRGQPSRSWVGLIAESSVHAGDRVSIEAEDCGLVTSAARSPVLGHIAGAMLRKEALKPGQMVSVITPSATVRAEVRPMPLLPPR